MLALWEFFWTGTDWTPAVVTPPATVEQDPGAGGGGRKQRHYEQASPDFWEVRERYLRRFAPRLEPEHERNPDAVVPDLARHAESNVVALETASLAKLQIRRAAAVRAAHAAPGALALRSLGAQIGKLTLDIARLEESNRQAAIEILLLDIL